MLLLSLSNLSRPLSALVPPARNAAQDRPHAPGAGNEAAPLPATVAAQLDAALARFDPDQVTPRTLTRRLRRMLERVEFDGRAGTLTVVLDPAGIQALARSNSPQDNRS